MLEKRTGSRWRWLLVPAQPIGLGRIEIALLAIYCLVTFFVVAHHEPWPDEAQAWVIAKSCTLSEILSRRLHYESAPALWQLLLFPLVRLHMPFLSMNWLSSSIAVGGAFLVLRYAPFPPLLRWLLPFTFFLQYQYAVIARPYACFPILAFGAASVFARSRPIPVLLAGLLGVAANTSLHGAAWATGMMLVYLLWLRRPQVHGQVSRQKVTLAVAIFGVLAAFSAYEASPAPDVTFIHLSPRAQALFAHVVTPSEVIPGAQLDPPEPPPPSLPPGDHWFYRGTTGPTVRIAVASVRRLDLRLFIAVKALFFSLSVSTALGALFLATFIFWLWSRQALQQIIPLLLVEFVFIAVWVWDHHTGIIFVSLIAAAWITLARTEQVRGPAWTQPVFFLLFIVVAVLQVEWSAAADISDVRLPYDAGGYTARFVRENYPGKKIVSFSYYAVTFQLYDEENPFANWSTPYWPWTLYRDPDSRKLSTLAGHPDVVVVVHTIMEEQYFERQIYSPTPVGRDLEPALGDFLRAHSWHITHEFCGDHFGHGGKTVKVCYDTYEPNPSGLNQVATILENR